MVPHFPLIFPSVTLTAVPLCPFLMLFLLFFSLSLSLWNISEVCLCVYSHHLGKVWQPDVESHIKMGNTFSFNKKQDQLSRSIPYTYLNLDQITDFFECVNVCSKAEAITDGICQVWLELFGFLDWLLWVLFTISHKCLVRVGACCGPLFCQCNCSV